MKGEDMTLEKKETKFPTTALTSDRMWLGLLLACGARVINAALAQRTTGSLPRASLDRKVRSCRTEGEP